MIFFWFEFWNFGILEFWNFEILKCTPLYTFVHLCTPLYTFVPFRNPSLFIYNEFV